MVVQWLRIHVPMQGTWVPSQAREDPTCLGATKPLLCSKRSHHSEEPLRLESRPCPPQLERAHRQQRRPAQPKTTELIYKKNLITQCLCLDSAAPYLWHTAQSCEGHPGLAPPSWPSSLAVPAPKPQCSLRSLCRAFSTSHLKSFCSVSTQRLSPLLTLSFPEVGEEGILVPLQDVFQELKRFSAHQIKREIKAHLG